MSQNPKIDVETEGEARRITELEARLGTCLSEMRSILKRARRCKHIYFVLQQFSLGVTAFWTIFTAGSLLQMNILMVLPGASAAFFTWHVARFFQDQAIHYEDFILECRADLQRLGKKASIGSIKP